MLVHTKASIYISLCIFMCKVEYFSETEFCVFLFLPSEGRNCFFCFGLAFFYCCKIPVYSFGNLIICSSVAFWHLRFIEQAVEGRSETISGYWFSTRKFKNIIAGHWNTVLQKGCRWGLQFKCDWHEVVFMFWQLWKCAAVHKETETEIWGLRKFYLILLFIPSVLMLSVHPFSFQQAFFTF